MKPPPRKISSGKLQCRGCSPNNLESEANMAVEEEEKYLVYLHQAKDNLIFFSLENFNQFLILEI